MKDLLLRQYKRYPKMQLQDAVKLVYQNEFGGGHMIHNEKDSLTRLKQECGDLGDAARGEIMFEGIGSGLCRLNLRVVKNTGIDITTVNRFFVNTAGSVGGSISGFEEKTAVLVQCCKDAALPFSEQEAVKVVGLHKAKGYPPISHSEAYHTAYSPAYRVVKIEYRVYFDLFCAIDSLMRGRDTLSVAIDGNSGSGKTTLAALIADVYDCNVFPMDHFFLSSAMKTKDRIDEVGGNVDHVRFKKEVLCGIKSGRPFQYRAYDCKTQTMGQPVSVSPKRLNIIEGCYSLHPSLIGSYDLKVFLHISEDEQKRRLLKRSGAFMLDRYIREWIPLENRYFDEMRVKQRCDLVFGSD